MADKSKIEWTDASWTPVRARNLRNGKVGWHCEHATTGCEFCYAEVLNKRLGTGLPFKPGHRSDIEIFLDDNMLLAPLRWKKPRMIFVCSMTDLFADFVPDEWIDKVFAVMALCPQHTFQVLTKRAERMRDYMIASGLIDSVVAALRAMEESAPSPETHRRPHFLDDAMPVRFNLEHGYPNPAWPLPNVWLGISTERQKEADERIPLLLQTPAAVRFISAEPLLGPIDISDYLVETARTNRDWYLDWVIAGGESGPGARPSHPAWPKALRDQCAADSRAKFFFKQWGAWVPHKVQPGDDLGGEVRRGTVRIVHPSGRSEVEVFEASGGRNTEPGSRYMRLTGKKAAGRLLDGITHDAMPSQKDHVIKKPERRAGGE